MLLSLAPHVFGAQAAPEPAETVAAQAQEPGVEEDATVMFFNRPVMTFRTDLLDRTPAQRARAAEASIQRIVDQSSTPKADVQVTSEGLIVTLGGQWVGALVEGDLDALHNQTMDQMRQEVTERLQEAVDASTHENTPRRLLHGALLSLLALALGFGALYVLLRFGGRADVAFGRWFNARIAKLHNEPARHVVNALRTAGRWTLRLAIWMLALLILEEVVRFVLGRFSFTRPWSLAMTGWIVTTLLHWIRAIAGAIPGLLAAIVILLAARAVTRTITLTFRGIQSGRFSLFGIDSQLAEPTRKLVVAVIWLFALAMAYPYLPGAQTDAFKGLSVLVGLMISLGASSIVGQAAGGFTLLYSRTMSIGDLVRIGDYEGTVTQIGLFTTRLRTLTGVEVSVPNTVALSGQMQNFSRNPEGPGMWLKIAITIGYDTPWRQVHRLMLEAAIKTDGVQQKPKPYVLQTELSDFYVAYELRARIAQLPQREKIRADLIANILDAFNTAGVQIMSPNYIADTPDPKLVPPDQWDPPGPEASVPTGNDAPAK